MEYHITEVASAIGAMPEQWRDCHISILLTDSRRIVQPEASLFFALKTKTNNGHKYIDELYNLRVRNFVVSEKPANATAMTEANFLVVKDTMKALQKLAIYHRKRFDIPVIGITGSNGKTIVKEFLYQLLHSDFKIVRSPCSYNSKLGVPLSIWEMSDKHTLGIFEAGISQPEEMEDLRPIIAPTIGILTGIGEAHQENFISLHQKCMEKLSLFTSCQALIYNSDNNLINNCVDASLLSHRTVAWSRYNSDAPVFLKSVNKRENDTEIICSIIGIPTKYIVPFTDDVSIENVMHCITLLLYLKTTLAHDTARFSKLEPVEMRLNVREGNRNCILIDDVYNSDFNSLEAALNFMRSRQADKDLKSVLILSDILQSGTLPKSFYKRVAELVKQKKIERIIGIGQEISEHATLFDIEKEFYPTTENFLSAQHDFHDEIILLKGSHRFHFERIAELLEKKTHQTVLEVDLDAITHNFNHFRSLLLPSTKLIAMVKAFGYGAGSNEAAKTLQERRCDYLAVAIADEGAYLRREGISIPIIVMNPEQTAFHTLLTNQLEPEIYSQRILEAIINETRRRGITNYPVHIKIDTGMHRLGFQPGEIETLCRLIRQQSGITVSSVFSHLAASDSPDFDNFTLQQIAFFRKAADELEASLGHPVMKHILNSAGIERFPQHQMDMVRLGIGLYGISAVNAPLQNVSTLRTTILQIRNVPAGDSVGYSRRTVVSRNSRIAVIPIGYADGLDRRLGSNHGQTLVNNRLCPIVGNICMDTTLIDVTDVPASEGDSVIIFGKDISVSNMAEKLDTIPYEILTSISTRVKRIYTTTN
ncbi:MAG: bifunctional UDP-N-acetylmuramoyl-tripeptide:D-alanyl-D-alanine ligase/alanine racemase [Tannerellaceae bacterium]|jgi:alanine racemase|nr:bifunctional UDP-N-acetylmuramoyl-tripeptide:D-alanyl-D-alanine ligase/alanine racemase [Tannerellaceae bacterium]